MGTSFDFECQGFAAARNWFFGHAAILTTRDQLSIVLWSRIARE
jgi:hypothetical protein